MKPRASLPRPTMAEIARDPGCLDRWKKEYLDYCAWIKKALAPLREAERLRSEGKQTWPPLSDYERDDMDSEGQIATLDRLIAKQKKGREKLVGLIHARSQQLAARQPRLVVDNTSRSARVTIP